MCIPLGGPTVLPSTAPSLMPALGSDLATGLLPAFSFPAYPSRTAHDERLVRLGGSLFRVYPFETRRCGENRSSPPRTVGFTSMALGRGSLDAVGAEEAVEVCLAGEGDPNSKDAAKE